MSLEGHLLHVEEDPVQGGDAPAVRERGLGSVQQPGRHARHARRRRHRVGETARAHHVAAHPAHAAAGGALLLAAEVLHLGHEVPPDDAQAAEVILYLRPLLAPATRRQVLVEVRCQKSYKENIVILSTILHAKLKA